jgi:hypothetical protein
VKTADGTPSSAQWIQETEQLVKLDSKLPAFLSGQTKPADAAEARGLALICHDRHLYGGSARFWAVAFQAEPKLADGTNRYNAACDAALAGCGQGKDEPPLDDAAKARWRKQALDWLKPDLAAWSKVMRSSPPQARASMTQSLAGWKADPDLAGLRDPEALKQLSEAEQKACRALWAEVDKLLVEARAGIAR